MEYIVFSDESRYIQDRFRSIAAVSLPYNSRSHIDTISAELRCFLECSKKGELKWKNVGRKDKRNVERAKTAVNFVFSNLSHGLRLDIVIWDTMDSRHSVEGRDDYENYSRMYFHLHRDLMRRRESNARWRLHPDELSIINWDTIRDCLSSDGAWLRHTQGTPVLFEEARWIAPRVEIFQEVDSAITPFVQLADLFAGMAAYTRTKSDVIKTMLTLAEQEVKPDLFLASVPTESTKGNTDSGRFKVISHLNQCCKKNRLGVSLGTYGYFSTRNPRNPINLWHYEPQHPHDRAPTREQGLSA